MPNTPHRPAMHDVQPPPVYRAGITLRRSFLVGPADTAEEQRLKALLSEADKGVAELG